MVTTKPKVWKVLNKKLAPQIKTCTQSLRKTRCQDQRRTCNH